MSHELEIAALVASALAGDEDDQTAWDAVVKLQTLGSDAVFEAASSLLRSAVPRERGRGVDILAQLGTPTPTPQIRARCADEILCLLSNESEPAVLNSIGVALGHLRDARAVAALLALRVHPHADVRFGVVWGLTPHATPEVTAALIELSADPDSDVRDWATFGLGTQSNVDSPEVRDALAARLEDSDEDVRGEAVVGLARRKDPRVLEVLRKELAAMNVRVYELEAAESLGDPDLLPLLRDIRDRVADPGYFGNVLASTIAALEKVESGAPT